MQTDQIKMGSFWFWLVWKMIALIGSLVVILLGLSGSRGLVRLLLMGLCLSILFVASEEIAYGHACEEGIHYRRYFWRILVSWRDVAAVRWSTSTRLKVELKRGFLFRKTLWMESAKNVSWATYLAEPPEVVRWLLIAKPEGSDGILLEGPGV